MKFSCSCGRIITDGADGQPDKAHVIPDVDAHAVLDAIDAAIEQRGSTAHAKMAASMRVRVLLSDISRRAWQCGECGRIWVEGKDRSLESFAPEGQEKRLGIFNSKRAQTDLSAPT